MSSYHEIKESKLKRIYEKFGVGKDYTKQEIFEGLKELGLAGDGFFGWLRISLTSSLSVLRYSSV